MKKLLMAAAVTAVSGAVLAQMGPGPAGAGQAGRGMTGMGPGVGPQNMPMVMRPIPGVTALPGAPLAGLTADELAAFQAGRAQFLNTEAPQTGLGPLFNGRSCVQCHGAPVAGGSSGITVTRFGRVVDGAFDPMESQGGSLLQRLSTLGQAIEVVPPGATVVAQRVSTALYGAGLIEAIPDATIQALATAAKPDGVRGRAAIVRDAATGVARVGRFGWKAQHATLTAFSADALRNEMGITNRFFPTENTANGPAIASSPIEDGVDPATGLADLDRAATFMRLLAPPPRGPLSPGALAGESLYTAVGCAACHVPTLATGQHAVAALSEKPVGLFSDLLLHDMGSLNDGIAQDGAGVNEMKTPPLWGLRFTPRYLHDGRANTVDQAIRLHDGEGAVARDRYIGLTATQRQQLLDYLGSL